MSTNDLIYILENRAVSNGFIIDEENAKAFQRELSDFATDLAKLVVKARQYSRQLLLKQVSFLLCLSFTSLTDCRMFLHIRMLTTLPRGPYPHPL